MTGKEGRRMGLKQTGWQKNKQERDRDGERMRMEGKSQKDKYAGR